MVTFLPTALGLITTWGDSQIGAAHDFWGFEHDQIMSVDYFIAFGVMFTGYCAIRLLMWWQFRMDGRPVSRPEFFDGRVPFIDAASLSKRLEQLRQSQETKPQGTSLFKKSFLVESRREQVAQSGFFQKPPPPEPLEEEHGTTVFLV